MPRLLDRIIAPTKGWSRRQLIGIYYLLFIFLVGWGVCIERYEFFPYSILNAFLSDIEGYVQGDPEGTKTSLLQKLSNDLNWVPHRLLVDYTISNERDYRQVAIPSVRARREPARVFQSEQATPGFRVIYGTFDFERDMHGAILLDESGQVVHTWVLHEGRIEGWEDLEFRPPQRKVPHGFSVLPTGSVVFAFDRGASLQKFDWCSQRQWVSIGHSYSHSINLDDHGALYCVGSVKVDQQSGKLLKTISFSDVMEANRSTDILGIRQKDARDGWNWLHDPWHFNDLEPLSAALAPSFPQFNAGDLLVSARSINALFVMDPESLKIKWWRIGQTRRQHDPDWQPDGTITVYDNNMHRGLSRILKIDPKTYSSTVLFDGKNENFYSNIRGKHQVLENGNILITIPQQGRVIEINPQGDVMFEFLNVYSTEPSKMLLVSEAVFLPKDYFAFTQWPSCGN